MGFNRKIIIPTILSGFAGMLILHPLTMVIYWLEFHPEDTNPVILASLIVQRVLQSFTIEMIPMSLFFFFVGGVLGFIILLINHSISHKNKKIEYLTEVIGNDLDSIIDNGEGEFQEFKSSLRWNNQSEKVDREIEQAILKTIAGFMNNQAGTLLIGVNDQGEVLGLLNDYMTLKKKNRDGFEQHLMTLISSRVGADLCPLVHVLFHNYQGKDVCRVIIEPSTRPAYVKIGDHEKYYLRAGNTTRELTVHEAVEHIPQRWPKNSHY